MNTQNPYPKSQSSDTESGFTLIESLVAIVVLSVLLIATSPIIAFSVGTRAQARRIELGSYAARAYIDALRAAGGCTEAEDENCPLDPPRTISSNAEPSNAAPSGALNCPSSGDYCTSPNTLYCVDGDDDGQCTETSLSDMVVQPVTYGGTDNDASAGYKLLVRVYRADAFQEQSLLTSGQQSIITNAIGNRRLPVVQMSTEITPREFDYQDYCQRLNGGTCQ